MSGDETIPDERAESDEPEWWQLLMESRALFREALGGKEIDVDEIIHEMREERDIQILSTIYGEAKAREMVLGQDADSDETY